MGKIVAAEYVTLDGVMEEPAWTGPYFNEEMAEAQRGLLFESDALLLGRVTYEGFAAAWPTMTDEQGFADRMNSYPKHVASTTLDEAEWNATLIRGDVAEEVAALKRRSDRQMLIYGSGELVDTLLQHRLIDELRLMVHPIVLGGGKRLFKDGSGTIDMQLVDAKTTETGVAILTYRPAEEE